jgi:hypothetical protein
MVRTGLPVQSEHAHPGDELDGDIEWIAHHKGKRLYNRLSRWRDRWEWNLDFRAVPANCSSVMKN